MKKSENKQNEIKENKSEKKVGRNEKCPCGSEKSLNIVTEIFNFKFLKAFRALARASS